MRTDCPSDHFEQCEVSIEDPPEATGAKGVPLSASVKNRNDAVFFPFLTNVYVQLEARP